MKRFIVFFLVVMIGITTNNAFCEQNSTAAKFSDFQIYVNGIRIALFDDDNSLKQSVIVDGTIYLPIESFINSIGGVYEYNDESNTITIELNNYLVSEPTATSKPEDDLESKAFTWSSFRDKYIKCYKEAANAFKTYARKNFKNPGSVRIEEAYHSGGDWILLDVSAENSFGGRTRAYYHIDIKNGCKIWKEDIYLNFYKNLGVAMDGADFAWFSSLFN